MRNATARNRPKNGHAVLPSLNATYLKSSSMSLKSLHPTMAFSILPSAPFSHYHPTRSRSGSSLAIILHSRREARRKSVSFVHLLPSYYHPLHQTPSNVRRARTGPHRKLRPSNLTTTTNPNDEFDTLMNKHFKRLPVVRTRNTHNHQSASFQAQTLPEPLLPCADQPI
jgi:hypothetical protein